MNENAKTAIFVAIAATIATVVWLTRPGLPIMDPKDMCGQQLFPEFNDPLAATDMEIMEFDDEKSMIRPFQVAQAETTDGQRLWSIPSHDNYPADAEDQLAAAAGGLMGLKILNTAGDSPGDHELFGVVEADLKTLKVGATGVGTRVVMKDKSGKVLLSLIIGKEVPDRDGLRYVRRVGEDQVYIVAVRTDKLSTKFGDWIEKDLLKLNPWDIKRLWFRNYSVDEMNMALIQRGEITLEYDDSGEQHWKLLKDDKFQQGKWVPVKMPEDEELNTKKLDEMKNALDDLKIVDVRRKPAGLSADLKADDDFSKNQDAVVSLANRGFYVAKLGERIEMFSNEGEIRCLMKDGVEYVLRFGEIAAGSAGNAKKDENDEDKDDEDGEKSSSSGLNRYLMVTTEFNPEVIPKPELEPLPEKTAEKPAEEKAEEKIDEKPEDIDAERKRIETANKRKQDEYDEKIASGKERVKELNARFADWYYIISDSVFNKIHLDRDDIFKKKEQEKEEGEAGSDERAADNPVGAFGDLKHGGPGR